MAAVNLSISHYELLQICLLVSIGQFWGKFEGNYLAIPGTFPEHFWTGARGRWGNLEMHFWSNFFAI